MNWVKLILAALFETGWVIGLAHADSAIEWLLTLLNVTCSFYLLLNATKYLPVGTAYAIFVGLGATLVTVVDVAVYEVPLGWQKVLLITILILGVIGLKLATEEETV